MAQGGPSRGHRSGFEGGPNPQPKKEEIEDKNNEPNGMEDVPVDGTREQSEATQPGAPSLVPQEGPKKKNKKKKRHMKGKFPDIPDKLEDDPEVPLCSDGMVYLYTLSFIAKHAYPSSLEPEFGKSLADAANDAFERYANGDTSCNGLRFTISPAEPDPDTMWRRANPNQVSVVEMAHSNDPADSELAERSSNAYGMTSAPAGGDIAAVP